MDRVRLKSDIGAAASQRVFFALAEPNGQLAGVLLKVVEDTPEVYNLLVCTLCSCYPISILVRL